MFLAAFQGRTFWFNKLEASFWLYEAAKDARSAQVQVTFSGSYASPKQDQRLLIISRVLLIKCIEGKIENQDDWYFFKILAL